MFQLLERVGSSCKREQCKAAAAETRACIPGMLARACWTERGWLVRNSPQVKGPAAVHIIHASFAKRRPLMRPPCATRSSGRSGRSSTACRCACCRSASLACRRWEPLRTAVLLAMPWAVPLIAKELPHSVEHSAPQRPACGLSVMCAHLLAAPLSKCRVFPSFGLVASAAGHHLHAGHLLGHV